MICNNVCLAPDIAAYIAGIVDGEGSLTIHAQKEPSGIYHFHAKLSISNTNEKLMIWLKNNLLIGYSYKTKRKQPHNDVYTYTISANGLRWLLPQIRPYLVLKKEQADLILEYLQNHSWSNRNFNAVEVQSLRKKISCLNGHFKRPNPNLGVIL